MTNLNTLRQHVGKLLLTWGGVSFLIGIVLLFSSPGTLLGGIGVQTIIWGIIDAFIAYYLLAKQKEESVEKIAKTVYRNIGMDIIFQVVGFLVILTLFQDPYMVGNGIGVIIQGFFLLSMDSYYYNALKKMER